MEEQQIWQDFLEEKALGQLGMQLQSVFDCFKFYGQDIYIPGAIEEAKRL